MFHVEHALRSRKWLALRSRVLHTPARSGAPVHGRGGFFDNRPGVPWIDCLRWRQSFSQPMGRQGIMRCPVCRAENDDVTCRRCKADLTLLTTLEQARRHALAEAAHAAAAGDGVGTLEHAEKAHRLRADRESFRLLAVGCLLQRDFAKAMALHRQARTDM